MNFHQQLLIGLTTICIQLPTSVFAQSELVGSNPFVGVWLITQTTTTDSKGNFTVDDSPEMGIYIFTDRYFSVMLVPGSERDNFYFREHSDAERLRAYDNFSADSGTYEYNETTLTMHNMIAKIPDVMQFSGAHEWHMEGKNMFFVFSGLWAPPDSQIEYMLTRLE